MRSLKAARCWRPAGVGRRHAAGDFGRDDDEARHDQQAHHDDQHLQPERCGGLSRGRQENSMSDAGRHFVTFDQSASGERLDRALAAALPSLTRSRVKALIESRRVALADGRTIEEPSRKVKTGERFVVDIPEPEPAEPEPQAMDLDILYEDSDLLVLNKPAGLVVHPGAGQSRPHAGQCPAGALRRQPVGHRRRAPAGHRASARQGHVGRDGGGQERRHPSGALQAVRRPRPHPHLPGAGLGRAQGRGRAPSTPRSAAIPSTASAWRCARPAAGRRSTEYWVEQRFGPPLTADRQPGGRRSSRPAAPIRSASIWPISAARWSAIRSMAGSRATPPAPRSLKTFGRQALHAAVLEFRHPRTRQGDALCHRIAARFQEVGV